jgi:hypothetical protein
MEREMMKFMRVGYSESTVENVLYTICQMEMSLI